MDASKAGGASAIGFVEGTGRRNIDLANGVIVNPSSRHEMRRHDMRAGNIMAVVATVSTRRFKSEVQHCSIDGMAE
jgi:hypothetical protein